MRTKAGSWQVAADWARVLPAWFKALSVTAAPEDFAQQVTTLLSRHYSYRRNDMLRGTRRVATPQQRKALAEAERQQAHSGNRRGEP